VVPGLVEHQVLEQVREAGLAWAFVSGAHTKPSMVADRRRRSVDEREYRQAIAQAKAPKPERIAKGLLTNELHTGIPLLNARVQSFDQAVRHSHESLSLITAPGRVKAI
jgi:hypothetical protein